jgi:hypothetical protein
MVVDGNGQNFFAFFLSDNVLVQMLENFPGFQEMFEVFAFFLSPFFNHDLIAKLNTFVADVNCGPGNEFFDFFLAFGAERTSVIT